MRQKRRHERLQQNGKFNNGWAVMPEFHAARGLSAGGACPHPDILPTAFRKWLGMVGLREAWWPATGAIALPPTPAAIGPEPLKRSCIPSQFLGRDCI